MLAILNSHGVEMRAIANWRARYRGIPPLTWGHTYARPIGLPTLGIHTSVFIYIPLTLSKHEWKFTPSHFPDV